LLREIVERKDLGRQGTVLYLNLELPPKLQIDAKLLLQRVGVAFLGIPY